MLKLTDKHVETLARTGGNTVANCYDSRITLADTKGPNGDAQLILG
jgi:hypothetical protein